MNYKEYLDDYFAKYKDSEQLRIIHDKVLKRTSYKYASLIDEGYGNLEATVKVIEEYKYIKQDFPELIRMPRAKHNDKDMGIGFMIFFVLLFLLIATPIYWFAPMLGFIPTYIFAYFLFFVYRVPVDSKPSTDLTLGKAYILLLSYQMIMITVVATPPTELIVVLVISYGIIILFAFISFFAMSRRREQAKHTGIGWRIINGQLFKSADVYIMIGYYMFSVIIFVFQLLLTLLLALKLS